MNLKQDKFTKIEPIDGKFTTNQKIGFKRYRISFSKKKKLLIPFKKFNLIIREKASEKDFLNVLIKKNSKKSYPVFKNLFPIIIHPQTLLSVYTKRIKKNVKEVEINEYSIKKILNLHQRLKLNSYKPRIIYWDPNIKKSLEDYLVQESIFIVLEKIYEPIFQIYNVNSGFREKMSPQITLKKLQQSGKHNTYAIQSDISEITNTINHEILLKNLQANIDDPKLLDLINQFLRVQIFKSFEERDIFTGISFSNRLAQLLFNIFLLPLDEYIEKEIKSLIKTINKTQNRTLIGIPNRQNNKIRYQIKKNNCILEKMQEYENPNWKEIHKQKQKISKITAQLQKIQSHDKTTMNHRIFYVRYAGIWMLTVFGTQALTRLIKNKLYTFLKVNLELPISFDKILIKNIQKNWVCFLGFRIRIQKDKKFQPNQAKGINGVNITIDMEKILLYLRNSKVLQRVKPNKSIHRSAWAKLSDYEIIKRYRKILIKIFQYYKGIVTTSNELNWIYYILRTSCAKTLALKYKKRTINIIFKKYGTTLKVLHPNKKNYLQLPTIQELMENFNFNSMLL